MKKLKSSVPIIGIGILGYVHEFIISDKPELFPVILFGLIIIRGIATSKIIRGFSIIFVPWKAKRSTNVVNSANIDIGFNFGRKTVLNQASPFL